jgi:hypothetical protein
VIYRKGESRSFQVGFLDVSEVVYVFLHFPPRNSISFFILFEFSVLVFLFSSLTCFVYLIQVFLVLAMEIG